jgi:hypothetical protein
VRNTKVDTSLKMTLRIALAKLTFILSMVNLSSPRSSVFDTMRGMYLDAADAEWNGAPDASDADDMLSLNNNNGTVYIIYIVKTIVL